MTYGVYPSLHSITPHSYVEEASPAAWSAMQPVSSTNMCVSVCERVCVGE